MGGVTMTMGRFVYPRCVRCPLCGADIGYGCHTRGSLTATPMHKARWKKAGTPHPSLLQRAEASFDGLRRDRNILLQMPGATRLVLGL